MSLKMTDRACSSDAGSYMHPRRCRMYCTDSDVRNDLPLPIPQQSATSLTRPPFGLMPVPMPGSSGSPEKMASSVLRTPG